MKILNLTLVRGDDWEGVYDQYGRLVYQDHQIHWDEVLARNVCKLSKIIYCDLKWLHDLGHLPDRLSEVKEQG